MSVCIKCELCKPCNPLTYFAWVTQLIHCAGPASESNVQSAAVAAEQSAKPTVADPDSSLIRLDLQLQQLSVCASQRRLCATAAFLTVVQEVQDGLSRMAQPRTSVAAEIAATHKVA